MNKQHNIEQRPPFVLIPWQEDFMQALCELALEQGPLADTLFIFPHSRPTIYMEKLLAQHPGLKRPCIMPRILSVHELFSALYASFKGPEAYTAPLLERVGILLEAVRQEKELSPSSIPFPLDDAGMFFPWGVRLAELFEECFYHNREPEDFYYAQGLVVDFAASLLEHLGSLHTRYMAGLEQNNWTTAALTAFKTAQALAESAPGILSRHKFFEGKKIFIAGFHSLSGTEDVLFKTLWEQLGATVCLHTDLPAFTDSAGFGAKTGKANSPHWSCAPMRSWQQNWKASTITLTGRQDHTQENKEPQRINYYAGYDLHSQLAVMEEKLQKEQTDTAIILPDAGLLLPMLHHMPELDFNVSMGYPLARSSLFRLLENILELQENKKGGRYYWRDAVKLIRHPYIKMLTPPSNSDSATPIDSQTAAKDRSEGQNLRILLHKLEHEWRSGQRFIDINNLEIPEEEKFSPEILAMLRDIFRRTMTEWEGVHSLSNLASTMRGLYAMLAEYGSELWKRFAIDAECLYRLTQNLLPDLESVSMKDEKFPQHTLFAIIRQLIEAERVPFEAYPLQAVQVMGLLESRLLRFKNIFILNAVDDLLPGSPSNDPLLPDSLRIQLGLPDAMRKQRLTAYHFFRLLAGAENIHLLWQEGIESKGLLDDKKLKSRFIEELIWGEEQKLGRVLDPQKNAKNAEFSEIKQEESKEFSESAKKTLPAISDGPLTVISCPVRSIQSATRSVSKTPALQQAILNMLSRPVSASMLDAYLSCPLRFYYERLAKLAPGEEVKEGDDPKAIGIMLHQTLRDFYTPLLGEKLLEGSLELFGNNGLVEIFNRNLESDQTLLNLPADSLAMLRAAGPERLRRFIQNQPETRVDLLEKRFSASLNLPNWCKEKNVVQLGGIIDRIDTRAQRQSDDYETEQPEALEHIILDYKTGSIPRNKTEFWLESEFWDAIVNLEYELANNAPVPSFKSDLREQTNTLTIQDKLENLFTRICENMPSSQLAVYLYLARFGHIETEEDTPAQKGQGKNFTKNFTPSLVSNAAWVELRNDGKEKYFLPEIGGSEDEEALRERILEERIPMVISFILGHLISSKSFCAKKSDNCLWCTCKRMCIFSEVQEN